MVRLFEDDPHADGADDNHRADENQRPELTGRGQQHGGQTQNGRQHIGDGHGGALHRLLHALDHVGHQLAAPVHIGHGILDELRVQFPVGKSFAEITAQGTLRIHFA